jgi:hypothetical protein
VHPVTPDGVLVTTSSPNGSLVVVWHTCPAMLVRTRSVPSQSVWTKLTVKDDRYAADGLRLFQLNLPDSRIKDHAGWSRAIAARWPSS